MPLDSHKRHIRSWFALKSVPGVGNHLFKRLLETFTSPEEVLAAPREALLRVQGMRSTLAATLCNYQVPAKVDREIELTVQKGYNIVTMADEKYPPLLHEIPDPPPYLYVYGTLPVDIKNIAIVGSRNATRYGLSTTRRLSADLASRGFAIISGMARGIDTAAHIGALEAKGKTIAVLGSGLERIYPRQNMRLFHQIAQTGGAVVSEFSLAAEPDAHHFPIRNRIISGLSLGTVIVEATHNSGSLITARLAAEQNREVFAVPGSVQSFKSIGAHKLLKQGAKLVEHAQDVIDELPDFIHALKQPPPPPDTKPVPAVPSLSSSEAAVVEALEPYPIHIDKLLLKSDMDPGRLAGILLTLEIKGVVCQHPGKLFSICEVKD